mmetsp:Transcript_56288/g.119812  ORF Transcript_56288/g.119812 Transcript_56288/m.119812 type:complete len:262 (+) Transcript_56288:841-1626(+)
MREVRSIFVWPHSSLTSASSDLVLAKSTINSSCCCAFASIWARISVAAMVASPNSAFVARSCDCVSINSVTMVLSSDLVSLRYCLAAEISSLNSWDSASMMLRSSAFDCCTAACMLLLSSVFASSILQYAACSPSFVSSKPVMAAAMAALNLDLESFMARLVLSSSLRILSSSAALASGLTAGVRICKVGPALLLLPLLRLLLLLLLQLLMLRIWLLVLLSWDGRAPSVLSGRGAGDASCNLFCHWTEGAVRSMVMVWLAC